MGDADTTEVFDTRLQQFKKGSAVQDNPKLLEYLEGEWFNCIPLWVKAYRQTFHLAVNTNNYVEAMNNTVKNVYLHDNRPKKRLVKVIKALVDDVFPDYEKKYTRENALSGQQRRWQDEEGGLFHGLPHPIQKALKIRWETTKDSDSKVLQKDDNIFFIERSLGTMKVQYANAVELGQFDGPLESYMCSTGDHRYYQINWQEKMCTCPDFKFRRIPCKHIFKVRILYFMFTDTSHSP